MLRLRNICAGYGETEILHDISIDVAKGEVVTIIGANGAGKTTTLRAICGLVRPTAGSIEFEDRMIGASEPHRIVASGITLVPEGRQLFPFMSVRENLLLGAYSSAGRAALDDSLAEVLELFPRVGERLDQFAGSLSGGEQQMVAIARGLMARPKLLMLDEPSLGLAPIVISQVFDVIDAIVKLGATILIVEQNIFHTLSICDRGYVIENGAIALADTGAALLRSDHVRRAYLGL